MLASLHRALPMSRNNFSTSKFVLSIIALVAPAFILAPSNSVAQQNWVSYQLVPTTVYEKKPMKVTRWVDETTTEKKQVTSYKPIWQTEKRERKQVVYKPIQETLEREEKIILRRPVVETLFRDKTVKETTYETVTKYRDEEYTVREPVTETEMRTESYTVRKPVTEKMIEVTKTTTFKPVVGSETEMASTQVPVIQLGSTPDPNARPRVQWLQRGYYTDPSSGQTVYRKPGFHWVQPNSTTASVGLARVAIPQEVSKLSFVPETTEERKPIEITRYVEEQKTREVPVEVERIVERTETRRVPYEVKVPKTTITTEKIPYKRTTYKEEVITKKVPYTRSTLKKVETIEPYEVEAPRWITKTEEVEVPKTVRRKVEYEVMQDVAKVVMMKVPFDTCGNRLAMPSPVSSSVAAKMPAAAEVKPATTFSSGFGSTLIRRAEPLSSTDSPGSTGSSVSREAGPFGESVIQKTETSASVAPPTSAPQRSGYRGTLELREPKSRAEASASSVTVPETTPSAQSPRTSLKELETKTETSAGSFSERWEDEIVHRSQITNRVPRASQWRREEPSESSQIVRRRFNDNAFGEDRAVEPDVTAKKLIETSTPAAEAVEEPISLPAAAKPDTTLQPGPTGDENAADRLFKSAFELGTGS